MNITSLAWHYILTFGRYCRKFIVGDDWMVTAIICWGIALEHSFSESYFFNPWYLLPLVVIFAIVYSLNRVVRERKAKDDSKGLESWQKFIILWLPMCLVTLLPPVIFFFANSYVSAKDLLLPTLTADLLFITLASLILYKFFARRPLGSSIAAAIAATYIDMKLQPHFLNIFNSAQGYSNVDIIIILYPLLLIFLGILIWNKTRRSVST